MSWALLGFPKHKVQGAQQFIVRQKRYMWQLARAGPKGRLSCHPPLLYLGPLFIRVAHSYGCKGPIEPADGENKFHSWFMFGLLLHSRLTLKYRGEGSFSQWAELWGWCAWSSTLYGKWCDVDENIYRLIGCGDLYWLVGQGPRKRKSRRLGTRESGKKAYR